MDSDECDICVDISCDSESTFDLERFKSIAKSVCRRFSVVKAAVSIAIVDDEAIAVINKQFLDHNGPTDVISFDLSDGDGGSTSVNATIDIDGFIGTPTVNQQLKSKILSVQTRVLQLVEKNILMISILSHTMGKFLK